MDDHDSTTDADVEPARRSRSLAMSKAHYYGELRACAIATKQNKGEIP